MMKKIKMALVALAVVVTGVLSVNAAYGQMITFNLPGLGSASSPWMTAPGNYAYATSHVNSTKNGGTYNTTYQTNFNNTATSIGSSLKLNARGNTGNAVWYPVNKTANGGPYTPTVSSSCGNGLNTTNNYCAVANSQYRLTLKNNYLLSSAEIVTLFTLD